MKQADLRDLVSGLVLLVFGLFVAVYASSHYDMGRLARMGPGFFPTVLGWILVALGAATALLSLRSRARAQPAPTLRLRPLVAVLAAVLVFALLVNRLGLMPATIALVFVAAAAERGYRWKRTALLAVSLAVMAWLIFIVGLQMTLSAVTFAF